MCNRTPRGEELAGEKRSVIRNSEEGEDRLVAVDGRRQKSCEVIGCLRGMKIGTEK